RADLKKHDPFSFQMMESVWGKQQKVAKNSGIKASPGDLAGLQLDKIDLGTPVSGTKISLADLPGRPVLLLFWNAGSSSSLSSLPKLSAWDAELSDFGLTTVGIHQTGTAKYDVK